ncbi:MAG: alpha/beta fold hydrolase [Aggregatilineales bacterium]
MTIEEKKLKLAGSTVSLLQGGASDCAALLLLHGAVGGAKLCWGPALPALAETHRVIAPDLPGFGDSAALPDMRTQTLLDWLERLLDALQIGQTAIVGSSLGALLARLFAATRPDRARWC